MEFRFADYRFDTRTLMLFRGDEAVALRNNEARLLGYFLNHPHQVLSKEQILDTVWAGKVVSEQAVFQAVSNLRQQFGEAAIKTYPKKGYQWELALETSDAGAQPSADTPVAAPVGRLARALRLRLLWPAVIVTGFLLMALAWLMLRPGASVRQVPASMPLMVRVAEQPVAGSPAFQADLLARLQREPLLQARAVPAALSEAQLMAAPEHYVRALFPAPGAGLLLTGRLLRHGDRRVLSFSLQGRENRWVGHLSGSTAAEVAEQLAALLQRVAPLRVLWESKDQRLVNAQLQLLHSEMPQSLPVLRTLVSNLVAIGEGQGAQLRLAELQQLAQDRLDLPYQVYALHARARQAIEAGQIEPARAYLDQALALGEQAQDASLQAQTLERYFTIHYLQRDFAALEEHLLQALRLAQSAQDPARAAELLFALTIASYKLDQSTKQDYYFQQTRALQDTLKLPPSSYAELEYFSGLNSAEPASAERLYRAALARFAPGEAAPAKTRALQQLVQLCLKQGRTEEALSLVQAEPMPGATERLLLAHIHAKQPGRQAQAVQQAELAFKAANLSGEYLTALDAALFLARPPGAVDAPAQAQPYRDFITRNATPLWRRQNQAALAALQPTDQR